MNKEKKNIIILIGIFLILLLIFFNSQEVKQNIITATELWATAVFPSLFPMFILSHLLIDYQFPEFLSNLCGKTFTKLYKTSSYGLFVLIMSFLSGTPSSAFLIKDLTERKKITIEEANFLLSFTFFSNPLFLLNMLSLIFPNNLKQIIIIILCHYLANFIIGIILRPKISPSLKKITINPQRKDLGSSLSTAINKSLDTLLLILGTITFYYMLANLIETPNPLTNTIISGFFELTQGLNKLRFLTINETLKSILALFFISFGGLSIHTQIKSIISDTSISYKPFLKGRFLHIIISIILFLMTTCITTIS